MFAQLRTSWLKSPVALPLPRKGAAAAIDLKVARGGTTHGLQRPVAFALIVPPLEFWETLLPPLCDKIRHKDILCIEFWETLLPYLEVGVLNFLPLIALCSTKLTHVPRLGHGVATRNNPNNKTIHEQNGIFSFFFLIWMNDPNHVIILIKFSILHTKYFYSRSPHHNKNKQKKTKHEFVLKNTRIILTKQRHNLILNVIIIKWIKNRWFHSFNLFRMCSRMNTRNVHFKWTQRNI